LRWSDWIGKLKNLEKLKEEKKRRKEGNEVSKKSINERKKNYRE
jgi:hypothetical protein